MDSSDRESGRKATTYWKPQRHAGLKQVLGRWWWLLLPLLGIVCAQAYVSPQISDSRSAVNKIKAAQTEQEEQLGAEWRSVDNERLSVRSVIDTLYLPEVEWHTRLLDSLRAVRLQIASAFPMMEAQIETLTVRLQALQSPLEKVTGYIQQTNAEIESYRNKIGVLRDSIGTLTNEQEALADRLYRLQHPEEFDRSRALISPTR